MVKRKRLKVSFKCEVTYDQRGWELFVNDEFQCRGSHAEFILEILDPKIRVMPFRWREKKTGRGAA